MIKIFKFLFFITLSIAHVYAQDINFKNIGTYQGLKSLFVESLTQDKHDRLWIATEDGLAMFNSKTITYYFKEQNIGLKSNIITNLYTSSWGNTYILTWDGISVLNDNGATFSPVKFENQTSDIKALHCFEIENELIILTSKKVYILKKGSLEAKEYKDPIRKINDIFKPYHIKSYLKTDANTYIFTKHKNNIIFSYNFKTNQYLEYKQIPNNIVGLEQLNKNEYILISDKSNAILLYNIFNHTLNPVKLKFSNSDSVDFLPKKIKKIDNQNYLITTENNGIYILNVQDWQIINYHHQASNLNSISCNYIYNYHINKNNNSIFLATDNGGISYFKLEKTQSKNFLSIYTSDNQAIDCYFNGASQDASGNIWLASSEGIFKYEPSKNTFNKIQIVSQNNNIINHIDIKDILVDPYQNIWFGTNNKGIAYIKNNKTTFIELPNMVKTIETLPNNYVHHLLWDNELKKIIISSSSGLFLLDPITKKITNFIDPKIYPKTFIPHIFKTFKDSKGNYWLIRNRYNTGLFYYEPKINKLSDFTNYNPYKEVYMDICEDAEGQIFLATNEGLKIKWKNSKHWEKWTKDKGMPGNYGKSIIIDHKQQIWYAVNSSLVLIKPKQKTFEIIEPKANINQSGFNYKAVNLLNDGTLFHGTYRGFNLINSLIFKEQNIKQNASIFEIGIGKQVYYFPKDTIYTVRGYPNDISIKYGITDYFNLNQNIFQHQLVGYDKTWVNSGSEGFAKYKNLNDKQMVFKFRWSNDGINWKSNQSNIEFDIILPFYKKNWFWIFLLALLLVLIYIFVIYRINNLRKLQTKEKKLLELKAETYKQQFELEEITSFFSFSVSHKHKTEDVLWDIAQNLIGKLGFVDCMIYLWNDDKSHLIQKAGFGPKGSIEEIKKLPFTVSLGQGVVGWVAQNKEAVIIDDTSKDIRYRVDEKIRYSELCVPVLYDNELIGVIDSEHDEKAFFTKKHLNIMTTIATLMANKIVAIENANHLEKQNIELMLIKNKMSDIEMTSLRSQMNPHFLFNALNSIKGYIAQNNLTSATNFINKFSVLIRSILNQSREHKITLYEELETLKIFIELEHQRYNGQFNFHIEIQDDLDLDDILLPPMLIQPYIENAIWHGLLNKSEKGNLWLKVKSEDNSILILIEDDGIGRKKSIELKSKTATKHKSLGLNITKERIELLNQINKTNNELSIIDLYNENNEPMGTKIILKLNN